MKNKIGVLNFQYSDHNYGAVLQAAALENVIREYDCDVEHINFIPLIKKNRTLKQKIISILEVLKLKNVILKIMHKKVIIKNTVRGSEVFELFRDKYIFRTKKYHTIDDLKEVSSKYDIVIVGSDQVWRPRMYSELSELQIYFLSFASNETKKISYAASFGVDQWEYDKKDDVTIYAKDQLEKFDSISVRENTGVEICKTLFNIDATHVLDPTLLIGRTYFDNIINMEDKKENRTISYYKLDLSELFLSGVKHITHMLNIQSVNIYYKKLEDNKYEYYPVNEWLSMIRNSSLIITDSFHCVCFAILFNKNFYCCINKDRGASRLESLLGELDLNDRLITEDDLTKIKAFEDIDYKKVNPILDAKRSVSRDFLLHAIKGNKNFPE